MFLCLVERPDALWEVKPLDYHPAVFKCNLNDSNTVLKTCFNYIFTTKTISALFHVVCMHCSLDTVSDCTAEKENFTQTKSPLSALLETADLRLLLLPLRRPWLPWFLSWGSDWLSRPSSVPSAPDAPRWTS